MTEVQKSRALDGIALAPKAKLQEKADKARKSSATAAILGSLSMVTGAFIACVAGVMGGRQRDEDELRYAARRIIVPEICKVSKEGAYGADYFDVCNPAGAPSM